MQREISLFFSYSFSSSPFSPSPPFFFFILIFFWNSFERNEPSDKLSQQVIEMREGFSRGFWRKSYKSKLWRNKRVEKMSEQNITYRCNVHFRMMNGQNGPRDRDNRYPETTVRCVFSSLRSFFPVFLIKNGKKLKEEKENIEDKFPGHSTHQCRRSASSYRIVVSYRFHLLRFCSPVDAIRSSNKIITTTTKWRSFLFFSFTIVTCVLCVRCVSWRRFCRSRPKIWKMLGGGGVCRGKWPQRQTRPFSFDGFVRRRYFFWLAFNVVPITPSFDPTRQYFSLWLDRLTRLRNIVISFPLFFQVWLQYLCDGR